MIRSRALLLCFSRTAACIFWLAVTTDCAVGSWVFTSPFGNEGGPYDTVEFFIISDPGGAGPFQGTGITSITNGGNPLPGWSASSPNPSYAVTSGPLHPDGFDVSLSFAGDMNNTLGMNMIIWNGGVGGTMHFAASFDLVNGVFPGNGPGQSQFFGPGPHAFLQHPTGIGYNRTAVPEPTSLGFAAAFLGFTTFRRRQRFA